jgi:glucan biosynthesis protein C
MTPSPRLPFIDHMRGFVFLLMAFDHALHAYAQQFGRFWFFKDYERTAVFDALYLFDQSMIMPLLFFGVGLFAHRSLQQQGWGMYLKRRLIKLGVPFLVGVPFVVPLLSYPRYVEYQDPGTTLWTYWTDIFFSEQLQAGPFWVMTAVAFYTLLLFFVIYFLTPLRTGMVAAMTRAQRQPLLIFGLLGGVAALIYGLSDLKWGAPWWIGFGKLFYLQGSRFIMNFVFLLLGDAVMTSGLLNSQAFHRWTSLWGRWLGLTIVLGAAYVGFSLSYFQTAYSEDIRRALMDNQPWSFMKELLQAGAWHVIVRTTFLGLLGVTQVVTVVLMMAHFLNRPHPFWTSIGLHAYGIFIFHETLTVWLQFALVDVPASPFFKMPIVFVGSFFPAWWISVRLGKVPLIHRYFGPLRPR